MNVERVVVDAYVTDGAQNPIPNLDAAVFTLRVDGKSYPIESVEWVDGERTELEPSPLGLEYQFAEEQIPHGRLLIFLFQIDPFQLSRLLGARRMSLEAKKIVASILPTDRVAVLSFDSHLK